jgi:hypothetical protein
MIGINKNGTKEKIGILLPASYPSNKVTYNGGTVKDALDDKVSKSGDTMSGNLTIDRQDGSPMIGGQSILTLGNNLGIDQDKNSEGLVYLYSMTGKKTVLTSTADGSDKIIEFPNKAGTVALKTDISDFLDVRNVGMPTLTVNASSYNSVTQDASRTGYTPIGIVGYAINTQYLAPIGVYLTGTSAVVVCRNLTSQQISASSIGVYVLYKKNM